MPEPGEETTTTTAAAHDKPHENNPPNPTLYVRNLCERVGVEELKKSLWQMFNQYGVIVDIYCRPKALKCKGQAWICFKTEESAQEAMSEMQGYGNMHGWMGRGPRCTVHLYQKRCTVL